MVAYEPTLLTGVPAEARILTEESEPLNYFEIRHLTSIKQGPDAPGRYPIRLPV